MEYIKNGIKKNINADMKIFLLKKKKFFEIYMHKTLLKKVKTLKKYIKNNNNNNKNIQSNTIKIPDITTTTTTTTTTSPQLKNINKRFSFFKNNNNNNNNNNENKIKIIQNKIKNDDKKYISDKNNIKSDNIKKNDINYIDITNINKKNKKNKKNFITNFFLEKKITSTLLYENFLLIYSHKEKKNNINKKLMINKKKKIDIYINSIKQHLNFLNFCCYKVFIFYKEINKIKNINMNVNI